MVHFVLWALFGATRGRIRQLMAFRCCCGAELIKSDLSHCSRNTSAEVRQKHMLS